MKKKRGIRKKAAVTVTLLIIFSLTLLGLVLSGLIFLNEKEQLLQYQREVLRYAVNEMEWDMHELEVHLDTVIQANDLLRQDRKEQHDTLSAILTHKDVKAHDILEELTLLDGSGRELTRVSRTAVFTASDLGERSDSYEFIIPKESGEPYYGPITYDEASFEPRIIMSMPIHDIRTDTVKGVLTGKIRLNRIWENAVQRSFGEEGKIFITNVLGKVVAHPDPSVIYSNAFFIPESPEGLQSGLNGGTVMLAGDKYYLGNQVFTVYTALPFNEVFQLSFETLSTTAAFLLFFICISILLSNAAANRIVRPIESLADNARNITEGRMVSAIETADTEEINDLSKAFNTMTSRLMDTIGSLRKEISERKFAEETIKKQNDLLNNIINSLTHPFYLIDVNDYTIKMANKASGFGPLSKESTCYALTHNAYEPCSSKEHPCVIRKIKETGKPATVEHIHYDDQGRTMVAEVHGYPLFDRNGVITRVIEYNLDITERKRAEEKLNASLREKEVLLREIHHRVKNNMQIISSLLNLQSMLLSNEKDIAMLKDSQNRIRAMSLIHEKLYRSENIANININEYINDLAKYILQFYEAVAFNVTLNIDVEEIWMGIDTAIPCGLIINELITNSLKYAFPEGTKGEIGITLVKSGREELILTISDNGAGIPRDIDFRDTRSLGLQLVVTLAENQLQGEIELDRTGGTTFTIKFHEASYEPRF